MAKIIEREFSREQFQKVCEAAVPHLIALAEILKENGATGNTAIYLNPKGLIDMSGGFDGWALTRLDKNSEFSGIYEYRERFVIAQDGAPESGK